MRQLWLVVDELESRIRRKRKGQKRIKERMVARSASWSAGYVTKLVCCVAFGLKATTPALASPR